MASTPLKISEEAMESAKSGYDSCGERMKSLRDTLKSAVDEIRIGWDSDGGKAFFKKFDDEWYKNFNDYIAVIEHMSENMTKSKSKYQPLFAEADKLNLN